MFKKIIYTLFSDQHRFVRRMKGGKWVLTTNPIFESIQEWLPVHSKSSIYNEDWDFDKWLRKVIKLEFERDIVFFTDEDDYLDYYERGLSPQEAINAYLEGF